MVPWQRRWELEAVAAAAVTTQLVAARSWVDSSEGDNREEPVVREEEIDETEVSEEVVVGVARLPKEPKSPVLPPPPGSSMPPPGSSTALPVPA